jgi:LysR family transcriptional regulator, glycine cleavage system transcriptional activator
VPATLPPLNALKAFEAAARLNGFALAAQELGVSPAAVSQLVRKLERHLGKTLFTRLNNRIILTDAGKAIFAGVTPAFADIVETVERVGRMSSRRKLVISSVASVAECWLLPALPRFLASHPRLRFDIRVEDEALAFPAEADLRISYGRLPSAEVLQVELCRDEVLPMCAPSFRRGRQRFTSALSKHLIHTLWGSIDGSAGHQVNASRLALQLAQAGAGIVLGQRWLAGPLLQRGDLVILSEKALPLGQSYHVSLPPSRARQPDVIALRDWLLTVAGGQVLPPHR